MSTCIHSALSLSLDTFGMSVIANPSNYSHFFCLSSVSHWAFFLPIGQHESISCHSIGEREWLVKKNLIL